MSASWPEAGEVDLTVLKASQHLLNTISEFKQQRNSFSESPKPGEQALNLKTATSATLWVARPCPDNSSVTPRGKHKHQENGKTQGIQLQDLSVASVLDEIELFTDNSNYIVNSLELTGLDVKTLDGSAGDDVKKVCCPGRPVIQFYSKVCCQLYTMAF
ncbi:leucine--tRNA ligase, cytoplasmic [Elysia marginata]|uniref:Leucine--tRNA ligase, cytoplasmic n=1 Tax=Elysia marginata TaxID=1093978 RepID=A0AAV4J724_9GAST|nr:leucine--tRNA ligase, cytoplasmic [Elysia marginata]